MADNEVVVRRKSARLNKITEQRAPQSEASQEKLPLAENIETVVRGIPLPKPSKASHPKLPVTNPPVTRSSSAQGIREGISRLFEGGFRLDSHEGIGRKQGVRKPKGRTSGEGLRGPEGDTRGGYVR